MFHFRLTVPSTDLGELVVGLHKVDCVFHNPVSGVW